MHAAEPDGRSNVEPRLQNGNVIANCPKCGVPTTFEPSDHSSRGTFGALVEEVETRTDHGIYSRTLHVLLRCTVCHRPGVASILANSTARDGRLAYFWPAAGPRISLPDRVPEGIVREFREAESAMSVRAWRGAAALLRSALEKALIANGYIEKGLFNKIEAIGLDGCITDARRKKAQDFVRTLGNDVLHEEWREVSRAEVEAAHFYVSRVVEDLYDDRDAVEKVLREKGRAFAERVEPERR